MGSEIELSETIKLTQELESLRDAAVRLVADRHRSSDVAWVETTCTLEHCPDARSLTPESN